MSKFKAGDYVEILHTDYEGNYGLDIGTKHRVVRAYNGVVELLGSDGSSWLFEDYEVKLADESTRPKKSKWQTMETAPRDGTEFLYWEEGWNAPTGCFFSQTLLDFCDNCFGKIIGVSDKGYWRPAPKLPKV